MEMLLAALIVAAIVTYLGFRCLAAAAQPAAVYEPAGTLLYFVRQGDRGTLLRCRGGAAADTPVIDEAGLHLADLRPSPDGKAIAAASLRGDGSACIVLFDADGGHRSELTAGDSIDCAPAWVPGHPQHLLFQHARIVRDARGRSAGHGPASLRMLHLGSSRITTVLHDGECDLLRPQVDAAGNLLYIRRPYASRHLLELLPLRLLMAPLQLVRAPAPAAPGEHAAPAPHDRHLVRRDAHGNECVLASHVAWYELDPDGSIVYSDGRSVRVLGDGGR